MSGDPVETSSITIADDSAISTAAALLPSPSFTPIQLSFFQACTTLLSEATSTGGADLAPLKRLLELCIHQKSDRTHSDTVTVLQHLLPDFSARLQSLHSAKVKVWLLEFLEQLVRLDASQFLPTVVTIVTAMTAEENMAVVKKVLSLGCTLFPLVYSWLSFHAGRWGAVHDNMHRTVEQLKSQLMSLWRGPNESIKPQVIKFCEITILTLTNEKANPPVQKSANTNSTKDELRPFSLRELPADHPVLSQAAIKDEVQASLTSLLTLAPATATTFSSLLKTLSILYKQRCVLLSDRIVERLNEVVDLIQMEEVQLQLLPSEQQVSRVKKDLQACLLEVLKNESFLLTNFDEQQTIIVRGLVALGIENAATEIVKQQAAKRAEHVKQQGQTYLKEAAKEPTQVVPERRIQPITVNSLMQQLDDLSRLEAQQMTDLILQSLNKFPVPASTAETFASPDPSPVFINFLQECLQANWNNVRADTQFEQRMQFEKVANVIKTHSKEALDTLHPPVVPIITPSVQVSVRTTVPEVPIPQPTAEQNESMSRSAFSRIASHRTATAVARSGESMLRNVILAKLATTNLLHKHEYTHIVNHDGTDVSTGPAWTSSLFKPSAEEKNALPLRAYISGRLQDQTGGGYESVLNVLYSLLCIETGDASVQTQVKEKEVEEAQEEPEEEETYDEYEDEDMAEEKETAKSEEEKKDSEGMTDVAESDTKKSRKRKEPEASSDDSKDASDEKDTKRVKTEEGASVDGQADPTSTEEEATAPAPIVDNTLPSFDQHGTVEYGEVLDMLLEELREGASAEGGRQHLYRRFLLDIPLLTPRVFASLDDWIYDPARSVIGLSALRDLILYRPPVRDTSLELLLSKTHKPSLPQLRNQAIRLVVNQLYLPNSYLRDPIMNFANSLLDALQDPDKILEDLPEIVVNVEVPPVPIYDQIELAPLKPKEEVPANPALERQLSAEERRQAADLKTRQEIANLIADAERRKKKFDRLVFLRSLREKEKQLLEQQRDERVKRRVDRIARHMELFLSLAVHNPSVFARVFQVYAKCSSEFVRKCVHEQMPRIIRVLLRVAQEQLIKTLEEESLSNSSTSSSGSSEPLILLCLQLITANAAPSTSLVQSVTKIYQHKNSPRYLIPILGGLPLDAIRKYLPKLITLSAEDLNQAFHKLLHSKPPSSIKPSELLMALHLIQVEKKPAPPAGNAAAIAAAAKERKEEEDALDKRVIAATKLCFNDPASYPPEVLAVVLNQLSDLATLPKLLMRTVMQSVMLHPELKGFIISSLLPKLIGKHIYLQPVLWQGFLAATNMLLPQSIPVLVQLPDQAFIQLMETPKYDKMQQQVTQFIQAYPLQVRRSIREIVQMQQQEKALALMVQQQEQQIKQQQEDQKQQAAVAMQQ